MLEFRRNSPLTVFLILLFVLLMVFSVPSVRAVEAPSTMFDKEYGEGTGVSVMQTDDGGYVIAGYNREGVLLIKVNFAGVVEWEKRVGSGKTYSVIETSDNAYVWTCSKGTLVKTSTNGDVRWNVTYPFQPYSVKQTKDGGFIVAGYESNTANDSNTWSSDVWLVKTDPSGGVLWNKIYEKIYYHRDRTYNWSPPLPSLVSNGDGYTLFCSTAHFKKVKDDLDFWLIKTDLNGNLQLNKTYGSSIEEYAHSMIKTLDGGYMMAGAIGFDSRDSWLVKTDSEGNVQWSKTGEASISNYFKSVIQTGDGGYMLLEYVQVSDGGFYYSNDVVKTDTSGNQEWNIHYPPTTGMMMMHGLSLIETGDGGYIFTGYKVEEGPPTATETYIWLVKIGGDPMPASILILSPENKTYTVNAVPLEFGVSELVSWVGYSLDGQANVSIIVNTILSGLTVGSHSVIVYAEDMNGRTGASETVYFTVAQESDLEPSEPEQSEPEQSEAEPLEPEPSEPFPTTWFVAASTIIVAAITAPTIYLIRKRKK